MSRALTTLVATSTLVTMLVAACSSDSDTPPSQAGEGDGAAAASECDPEVAEALAAWGEAGFSGSIAISTGGRVDCLASAGWADEEGERPNTADTVFSIGSISKAFTAAAILDLADAGELALTDQVGDLMPDLQGPVADATIQQLLLHTSGLSGSHGEDHQPLDHDEALAAIGRIELAFPPGAEFAYSNAGYTLLALVVEQVSGTPFRDYMAAEILPLPDGEVAGGFWDGEPAAPGPRAIGYPDDEPTDEMGDFPGPHWALAGNGDLAMTAGELAAWTAALFDGRIVSPASVDILTTPGFDHGEGRSETPGWVMFDASMFGQPFLSTAGGGGDVGHNAVTVWVPEGERAITMISNTDGVTAEDLLEKVGPALAAGEPLPLPEGAGAGGDADPGELAAVEGTYKLDGGGSFVVTADGSELAIAATGADAVAALFPPPDDASAHEDRVVALLAGETAQGEEELAALEADFGELERVDPIGTIDAGGELRTYVEVTLGGKQMLAWYAVDDHGGVSAVEVDTDPPSQSFSPTGDGELRLDDPTGSGADITVRIADGAMIVTGPSGVTEARIR